MSRRSAVLTLALVAAAAAGGYAYWKYRAGDRADATAARPAAPRRGGGPDPARPVPVLTAPVWRGSFPIVLEALGTVTARSTVTVRSRVDGLLVRLAFTEGQLVEKGQLLAEIDPRPFQVQLAQAEGQLARDRAQLLNAQVDLARYQGLLAKDSIARQQVENQAALVRQLQGTVAANQGLVDSAKLQLGFTRVTAPVAGRVGLKLVDAGNMVRAGDPGGIVVITEVQPIAMVFSVPADEIPAVRASLAQGEPPVVEAWDRSGQARIATGRLLTLDNQIDVATGTIRLKASFDNRDGALFPNQFVNARLQVRQVEGATLMPVAALQRGSIGPYAFVVKPDNTVAVRKVVPGPADERRVIVREGLQPGDIVVVDGTDRIRDGARVVPVPVDRANRSGASPGAGTGARPSGQVRAPATGRAGAPAPAGAPGQAPTAPPTR